MSKHERRTHVPDPGRSRGLYGQALCGRYARWHTGDHDLIRRLAAKGGTHWCRQCLRRLETITD